MKRYARAEMIFMSIKIHKQTNASQHLLGTKIKSTCYPLHFMLLWLRQERIQLLCCSVCWTQINILKFNYNSLFRSAATSWIIVKLELDHKTFGASSIETSCDPNQHHQAIAHRTASHDIISSWEPICWLAARCFQQPIAACLLSVEKKTFGLEIVQL